MMHQLIDHYTELLCAYDKLQKNYNYPERFVNELKPLPVAYIQQKELLCEEMEKIYQDLQWFGVTADQHGLNYWVYKSIYRIKQLR
jgi:hypothetical protein